MLSQRLGMVNHAPTGHLPCARTERELGALIGLICSITVLSFPAPNPNPRAPPFARISILGYEWLRMIRDVRHQEDRENYG